MRQFILSQKTIVTLILMTIIWQILVLPVLQAQQGRGLFVTPEAPDTNDASFRNPLNQDSSDSSLNLPGGIGDVLGSGQGEGVRSSGGVTPLIYQVHLLGEVKRAGTYRIAASTRLSEALSISGGVKKNGSERNIELRRGGRTKKIDLLAYKIFGHLENNPYLMDNDVIYIPLKEKVIEINGAGNRPGIYELKSEKTVVDEIYLGGGYSQGVAQKEPIRLIRYIDGEKEIIELKNDSDSLAESDLRNGDIIIVPHIFTTKNKFDYNVKQLPNDNIFYPSFEDKVFMIGQVNRPGPYNFNPNYKLSTYLAFAGGTNRNAKSYLRITDRDGNSKKVKPDSDIIINPGDTVYAPEVALTRETWIGVMTTIVSIGFTAQALFRH